jgi:hypothetical protein
MGNFVDDQVWWNRHGRPFPTSLVASSKSVSGALRGPKPSVVVVPYEPPRAAETLPENAADRARGATMQLDIRFWRTRWFWRLAVKATVRFFRS